MKRELIEHACCCFEHHRPDDFLWDRLVCPRRWAHRVRPDCHLSNAHILAILGDCSPWIDGLGVSQLFTQASFLILSFSASQSWSSLWRFLRCSASRQQALYRYLGSGATSTLTLFACIFQLGNTAPVHLHLCGGRRNDDVAMQMTAP